MAIKERFDVIASSLSSYFGVGFNTVQEQLDMLYWDKINGTNNWLKTINEIKRKYPKK